MRTYSFFMLVVLFMAAASCSSNTNNPEEPFRLLWEFAYQGVPEGLSLVTLAPEIIGNNYIAISPDRRLTNLDPKTGEVLWSNELPENAWITTNNLLHDSDTFYIKIDQTSKIVGWDILTGTKKWEGALPSGTFFDFRHDALDSQNLYLTGNQLSFFVFRKNGEFLLEKKMDKNPRALISDGTNIYVSQAWRPEGSESSYGRIVSYNSDSMDEEWSYTTQKGGFYTASMQLVDNVLYSGTVSGNGTFISLNANTGKRIWAKDLITYRFLVENDTIYVNNSLNIVALDSNTGKELWRTDFGVGDASDNIAYLNGYLYHSHGSALFILDAATGEVVHREPVAPDGTPFGNVAAANGRVFAQSDYHLYAYEAWK